MKIPLTYKNALQGKHNKAAGKAFENIISSSCAWYMQENIAKIEKQAEPMKPIKRLEYGRYIAIFESKAGVDYKGTLKGGRSVVFEAKHTDTDRFTRDVVKEWQLEYLVAHKNLGAECFVILSYGLKNFYRIPIEDWYFMKERFGRVSLREQDVQEFKLRTLGTRIMFLEGIVDENLWN